MSGTTVDWGCCMENNLQHKSIFPRAIELRDIYANESYQWDSYWNYKSRRKIISRTFRHTFEFPSSQSSFKSWTWFEFPSCVLSCMVYPSIFAFVKVKKHTRKKVRLAVLDDRRMTFLRDFFPARKYYLFPKKICSLPIIVNSAVNVYKDRWGADFARLKCISFNAKRTITTFSLSAQL